MSILINESLSEIMKDKKSIYKLMSDLYENVEKNYINRFLSELKN